MCFGSTEPDVDLENQYYNSKALKETSPQVKYVICTCF